MDFVGLQMLVTLKDPQGLQLKGTVSEVTPGASLVLSNVFSLGTDRWMPRITLEPDNIEDVSEYKDDPAPNTFAAPRRSPVPAPVISQPAQPAFTDPAIVSLGKRPEPVSRSGSVLRPPSQTAVPAGPQTNQPGVLPVAQPVELEGAQALPGSLNAGFQGLRVESPPSQNYNEQNGSRAHDTASQSNTKKRNRKPRQSKAAKQRGVDEVEPEDRPQVNPSQVNRGKGWRQTPMLQSTPSFQPFKSLQKNGKKILADNGWASEDVTEEMGDFDFEGSLAKFDKRTVFDQMRKEDLVDEAERLVSHNRRAKPGAAAADRKLLPSENVLDMPPTNPKTAHDFWNSEADDAVNGSERLSGREVRSAQSMRRTESKTGIARRSQSRKASATGNPHQQQQQLQQLQQPALGRTHSGQAAQPGFYLQPSGLRVETVSALQMLNLENIAANEVGLTEDMMAENAGRGIAEVALTALWDPAIQVRLGATGGTASLAALAAATIVVLAGNNKSGIRAVAAARHLRNKGINVLVCVVGIERERDLLEDMRQQIRIFKNFGGRVHGKIELFEQLRKVSSQSSATVGVTLIVDALLGLAISFEELRTGDQATVYELIEWANRNQAFTLAVDVPTGIDPSSGKVSIIDGGRLYVKPRYIVSMGAPKRGLLEAMAPPFDDSQEDGAAAPVAEDEGWRLFIADIGLGAAVWKKAGTKLRRGIDFDDKWVLEMRYQGAEAEEEPDY